VFGAVSDGYRFAIMAAFYLVCVEIFRQLSYGGSAECAFHGADTGAAEKAEQTAVPVVLFLTELV
jgi:hypothetical protein